MEEEEAYSQYLTLPAFNYLMCQCTNTSSADLKHVKIPSQPTFPCPPVWIFHAKRVHWGSCFLFMLKPSGDMVCICL